MRSTPPALRFGASVGSILMALTVVSACHETKTSSFSDGSPLKGDYPPGCVVPVQHRPEAVACPSHSDGGEECSDAAVCQVDAGDAIRKPVGFCLHGACSFDECLTDADCASNEVCACAGDLAGEATGSAVNACVPATCHVDSDCGSCGYCSPSGDPMCGAIYGATMYACHRPGDACYANTDCGPATDDLYTDPFCAYDTMTGGWTCAAGFCGG